MMDEIERDVEVLANGWLAVVCLIAALVAAFIFASWAVSCHAGAPPRSGLTTLTKNRRCAVMDCEACRYGAEGGGNTIVCCYYGSGETDPGGQCEQFEADDIAETDLCGGVSGEVKSELS